MASFSSILFWGVLLAYTLYQCATLRLIYLEHYREYGLRRNFVGLPEVHLFPWLQDLLEHSRAFLSRGLLVPVFTRWIEGMYIYRLITLDSLLIKFALFVMALFALYLIYQFRINTYTVDAMKGEMVKRTAMQRKVEQRLAGVPDSITTAVMSAMDSGDVPEADKAIILRALAGDRNLVAFNGGGGGTTSTNKKQQQQQIVEVLPSPTFLKDVD